MDVNKMNFCLITCEEKQFYLWNVMQDCKLIEYVTLLKCLHKLCTNVDKMKPMSAKSLTCNNSMLIMLLASSSLETNC